MGITITNIKVVGMCSKHRKETDEVLEDTNGEPYEDKDISCVGCALGEQKLQCPECQNQMSVMEERDSILGLGIIYTYGCEHCGGTFEIKRGK